MTSSPNIYYTANLAQPFVTLTTPKALENIARQLGGNFKLYSLHSFAQRHIDRDMSSSALWVIEAAYAYEAGVSLKELRTFCPNGKIVVLSEDAIWFTRQGKGIHQVNPFDCDLWLDLLDEVVEQYKDLGVLADTWIWTVSDFMLKQFSEYTQDLPVDYSRKDLDFVSFMTIGNDYRRNMMDFFRSKGLKFMTGSGCLENNVSQMIDGYRRAYFHIGSTSPSWTTQINTMKGFRDFQAAPLNCLLLYDNFPDVVKKMGGGSIIPLYDYDDFESILNLMNKLRNDRELYEHHLNLQRVWIKYYTLEKQFTRLFKKHGIIS